MEYSADHPILDTKVPVLCLFVWLSVTFMVPALNEDLFSTIVFLKLKNIGFISLKVLESYKGFY